MFTRPLSGYQLFFLIVLILYSYFVDPINDLVKDYIIPLTVIVFSFGQLLNSEKNSLFEIIKHNREVKSRFINSLTTLENDSSWTSFTHSQAIDFKNRAYCLHREASVFFRNKPDLVKTIEELKDFYWKHVDAIQMTGNNNSTVNRHDDIKGLYNEIYSFLMTDEETREWDSL